MFKFLTHKSFFLNLLVIIALIVLFVFIFFTLLASITKHNANIKVPSVTGKTLAEAQQILAEDGFEVAVQDSIYNDALPPTIVTRQSPESDENVKVNRTVFLTVNRAVPPMVEMPDLRGFSFKSAKIYLNTLGLKLGDTSFVPDIAKNAVKEQLYNKTPIAAGTKIRMGSAIGFILGSGISHQQFNVRDLLGMTVSEAKAFLSSQIIGLSAILVSDFITDTASAFIVKQNPETSSVIATGEKRKNRISPGQLMDVWISENPPIKDSTGMPEETVPENPQF